MSEINKKLAIVAIIIGMVAGIAGCNKQLVDLNYKFNYCYIYLQNGEVISGKVDSWTDFADGDQLQVKINGVTYLVHSSNCTLIYDPGREL